MVLGSLSHPAGTAETVSFHYGKSLLSAECTLSTASKPHLQDLVRFWGHPEQPSRYNVALGDTVVPPDFPLHLGGSCFVFEWCVAAVQYTSLLMPGCSKEDPKIFETRWEQQQQKVSGDIWR